MRRGFVAVTFAALVMHGTPSLATPPLPVVTDGFTISGPAGAQVRLRLARPLLMPEYHRDEPRLDLRASSGALAGYALLGRTRNKFRSYDSAYAVETTKQWTCGTAGCANGSQRRYGISLGTGKEGALTPGEYVLVLIGSPGARVDVTVHPPAGRAPRRLVPTGAATPVVEPTEQVVPSTGADVVATGTFTVEQRTARAVLGVVHSVAFQAGRNLDYALDIGRPGLLGSCGGWSWGGSRGQFPPLLTPFHYSFAGVIESRGTGERCATWNGSTDAPLTTQRGLGIYVPLVY